VCIKAVGGEWAGNRVKKKKREKKEEKNTLNPPLPVH